MNKLKKIASTLCQFIFHTTPLQIYVKTISRNIHLQDLADWSLRSYTTKVMRTDWRCVLHCRSSKLSGIFKKIYPYMFNVARCEIFPQHPAWYLIIVLWSYPSRSPMYCIYNEARTYLYNCISSPKKSSLNLLVLFTLLVRLFYYCCKILIHSTNTWLPGYENLNCTCIHKFEYLLCTSSKCYIWVWSCEMIKG
jgi:hypothetical protein